MDNDAAEQIREERWRLRREARGWFGFAIAGLLLSGVFAILIVLGRTPGVAPLLGDPGFFRRCLVVHVNLALVVWFSAFIVGLVHQLPSPASHRPPRWPWMGRAMFGVGMALMMAGAWVPGSRAILANYVPGVDNAVFMTGLTSMGLGVLLGLVRSPIWCALWPGDFRGLDDGGAQVLHVPRDGRVAVAAAGLALLAALATFFVSALSASALVAGDGKFSLSVWGGGHVMQVANVAAMCAVWLTLLSRVTGRALLTTAHARLVFGWLLVPALAAPLWVAFHGVAGAWYQVGFVRMMQFGLFPPVLALLGLISFSLRRGGGPGPTSSLRWHRDARAVGWFCSVALTLSGFVLGALIRGQSTMVPAHYHAAIGGVSVSFMAVTWLWWSEVLADGVPSRARRWFRRQPILFASGQLVFALGFGLAGSAGMARKVYADEQVAHGFADVAGLLMMAGGGMVAVAGGLVFLGLFARLLTRRARAANAVEEDRWITVPTTRSISFNG